LDADVVKIATMANHPDDNLRMLDLVRASKVPMVGICMGDIGVPTRVLGLRCGSPFTFATFHDDRVMAPGQIGWRQMRDLYRVDAVTDATKILGVIADPVAHSLSPAVHNAAYAAAGLDAVYLPFRVPAEHLADFLKSMARWPISGLSVTIPHKEKVLAVAKPADDIVTSIGASNTLVIAGGGLEAYNTDATAAIESIEALLESAEGEADAAFPKTALVLGAGGAARAVAFGLKQRHVDVTVTGRTAERARKLAADVGCKAVEWQARYRLPYDCIVNATPIGMHPNVDETPFDREHLRPYMIVFDTVYNPENTLLLKDARTSGCRTVTGVEMFVRQAAEQHRLWHGAEPPPGVMRDAVKRATASHKSPA
jgi:3-dehydroquinate dehydratase/shikimate dehydrogenase